MRRLLAALFVSIGLASACGLDARGTLEVSDGAGAAGPDAPDAHVHDSAGGGGGDADAAPCTIDVDDPLDALPNGRWLTLASSTNAPYPRAEEVNGTVVAVLTKPYAQFARGAMWLRDVLPLDAFDVELTYEVACLGPCADGFAVVWVAAADDASLANAPENGRSFGIPRGVAGGAVAVDVFRNDETGELETPNINVIEMDGVGEPGDYDWEKTSSSGVSVTGKHRLALSLRDEQISVRLDGAEIARAKTGGGFTGRFGITGATGAFTARLYIDDVRARFYRCAPATR